MIGLCVFKTLLKRRFESRDIWNGLSKLEQYNINRTQTIYKERNNMKIYIEETDNAIKTQQQSIERQQQQLDNRKRNLKRAKLLKQLAQLDQQK